MGVLAPLFLAGLAALSLPLLFHLVRRTPRGKQDFSSLMFLSPTPPRLTRRSRLDQILLLLMRLGALALLAFAFARPFLREAAMLSLSDLPKRRVAILVDTSASMHRADLWQQAVRQVERELDDLAPHDDVALFTFSDRLETAAPFVTDSQINNVASVDIVRQRLRELEPSWNIGDLGTALTALAGELDASSDAQQSPAEPQIIVVSDFQKGSRIEALQAFEWPKRVHMISRVIQSKNTTNAHAQLLVSDDDDPEAVLRVRVANASDSQGDQFFVGWASGATNASTADETPIYVPPGQSRVVKLPRPETNLLADRIVLRGDDHDFDNTFYVVPPRKQEVALFYAGTDAADDPQGAQYYLRLAVSGDPLRQVAIEAIEGDSLPRASEGRALSTAQTQLVVATRVVSDALVGELKALVEKGSTLVLAPLDRESAKSLPQFFENVSLDPPQSKDDDEASRSNFQLLGEIDFGHPLFAPFSNPRYNDFTRIHFWNQRPIAWTGSSNDESSGTRVLARFDSGHPWLLERSLGEGRVIAFTSGWHPDDSQLAVSTKFVPLIGNLLDLACGSTRPLESVVVGDHVAMPQAATSAMVVRGPENKQVRLSAGATSFTDTDQPGIYQATSSTDELRFAVNLAPAESDTAPLDLEQFEQLGVRVGTSLTSAERLDRQRQQRDIELESRQKVWRWLLVGCVALLIVETWWAGRAARPADMPVEAVA